MDNQRLLIWAFFILMGWMTWQTWQRDYGPQPVQPVAVETDEVLTAPEAPVDSMPQLDAGAAALPVAPQSEDAPAAQSTATTITVTTDVFEVEISTVGGTLQGATLSRYPIAKPARYIGQNLRPHRVGTQGGGRRRRGNPPGDLYGAADTLRAGQRR